ncbi:LOW QUALITY PROTEIN: hypothetical protein SORBI_3001G400101 [Sorghum bicolor]|uniref:Uncharacterized protein n=1 Tax=Sorghum bicolor TaxID=4558 RepID=A0A1Z5SA75_SORBI|nr:LOW QUALITY PROTEIN: hypothetical protein SORBI_3001G400101 [Sorghum bicolor]
MKKTYMSRFEQVMGRPRNFRSSEFVRGWPKKEKNLSFSSVAVTGTRRRRRGRTERIERARPPGAQPRPWLAGPGPMQQAHGSRVAAAAQDIVAAEAVLVPPVLDRRHVKHHDARVEVARPPPHERPGEPLVRPEPAGEVLGKVGVAVLGGADGAAAEVGAPELGDVVDEDEVGVEVDDAAHAGLEEVGQVVARIVERLLQRLPHRRGDEPADALGVEVVDLEPELREDRADEVPEARVGDEEVEEDALGAPGVLHHRVDRGDGAPQVLLIERNRDVDERRVADIGGGAVARAGAAIGGIAERRGAAEGDPPGAPCDLAREADAAVELRRPDGLGGREGLERRTTITMAADKKPDRRATHSIALPRLGHRFLAPGLPRGGGGRCCCFDHPTKTPCRRAMASSGGAARLLEAETEGSTQTAGKAAPALLDLNWIASRSPGSWRIGAWSGGEASGNPCEVRRVLRERGGAGEEASAAAGLAWPATVGTPACRCQRSPTAPDTFAASQPAGDDAHARAGGARTGGFEGPWGGG